MFVNLLQLWKATLEKQKKYQEKLDKEKAKQQLEELPARLQADEVFVNAARNSDRETAQQQCNMSLMMIIARMLNENTEFCRNYLDNPDFMNFINQRVFDTAYENANK